MPLPEIIAYILLCLCLVIVIMMWKSSRSSQKQSCNLTLKIMILRSCSHTHDFWRNLCRYWDRYGNVKLTKIMYGNEIRTPIDLNSLLYYAPDIIILSDTSGSPIKLDFTEIEALRQYLAQDVGYSRGLLGTYITFYYYERTTQQTYDNRHLMNLFNFDPTITTAASHIENPIYLYPKNYQTDILCKLGSPCMMGLQWPYNCNPSSSSWSRIVDQKNILAESDDGQSIIVKHDNKTYSSIYVNFMPEYESSPSNAQLIYNLIVELGKNKLQHDMSLQKRCRQILGQKIISLCKDKPIIKEVCAMPKELRDDIFDYVSGVIGEGT